MNDIIEKILDDIMNIDKDEWCEVERHEDYRQKHREILERYLKPSEEKWEEICWSEKNPHKAYWNFIFEWEPQRIYCKNCWKFIDIDKDTIIHKPKRSNPKK